MSEPGSPEQQQTQRLLPILPDVRGKTGMATFSKVAELDIPKESKDEIYIWCRKAGQTELDFSTLKTEIGKPTLPKAEAAYGQVVLDEGLESAKEINDSILKIFSYKPGIMKRIVDAYAGGYANASQDSVAITVVENIAKFKDNPVGVQLVGAVCAAINETRVENKDEDLIRKKIAQSVFDEMMAQLQHDRIVYKEEIDVDDTSIIDSPVAERYEIRSALSANPWTGEERRKRLREYNKLKRVLNIIDADTEVKVAFGRLWKWANGEIPQNSSVFKILEHADELYGGMMVLQDAWDIELEIEADNEEGEDED